MDNLMPAIAAQVASQEGLDVSALKKGTVLKVRANDGEYVLHLLGDGNVLVMGGTHFKSPTKAAFNGSTWGDSMLKLNWVGPDMLMEFTVQTTDGLDTVHTSGVQAVKVIADGISSLHEWAIPACTA